MKPPFRNTTLILGLATVAIAAIVFSLWHIENQQNLAATGTSAFSDALSWIIAGGYVIMFIGMLVEGPIISSAAAFGAALGYFSLTWVFVLSMLGDIIADIAYYLIGYFSRIAVVEKYGHRVGISQARLERLEHLMRTHPWKTLLAIKLTPVLPTPALMVVGALRFDLKQYTIISAAITLPKVIGFMALGYYFGAVYDSVSRYVQNAEYILFVGFVLLGLVYYGYKKSAAKFATWLEPL